MLYIKDCFWRRVVNKTNRLLVSKLKRGSIFQINQIIKILSRKRKLEILGVLLLLTASSLAELVNVGMMVLMLKVMLNPEVAKEDPFLIDLMRIINLKNNSDLILLIVAVYSLIIGITTVVRMVSSRQVLQLSYGIAGDVAKRLYANAIYQDMDFHNSQPASYIVTNISSNVANLTASTTQPLLNLLGSLMTVISLTIGAVIVSPALSITIATTILISYVSAYLIVAPLLLKSGSATVDADKKRMQALHEGLASVRSIIIDGTQDAFVKSFSLQDYVYRQSQTSSRFLPLIPKYLIEGFALITFACWGAQAVIAGNLTDLTISIGAIGFAISRILPTAQLFFSSLASIKSGAPSVDRIIELLQLKQTQRQSIIPAPKFNSIELRGVSYRYPGQLGYCIKEIYLNLTPGSIIGLIGKSGSGKSTLVDLAMGLLSPTNGEVLFDGRKLNKNEVAEWRKCISHVPQTVSVLTDSVARNVAMGCRTEDIAIDRLKRVLKQAGLDDLVLSYPEGVNRIIGDGLCQLSGGQRQRLGLARALYKDPKVIFLDEVTSSLDPETENAILETLKVVSQDLNKTIVMITHKASSISICDRIYKLDNGAIIFRK